MTSHTPNPIKFDPGLKMRPWLSTSWKYLARELLRTGVGQVDGCWTTPTLYHMTIVWRRCKPLCQDSLQNSWESTSRGQGESAIYPKGNDWASSKSLFHCTLWRLTPHRHFFWIPRRSHCPIVQNPFQDFIQIMWIVKKGRTKFKNAVDTLQKMRLSSSDTISGWCTLDRALVWNPDSL